MTTELQSIRADITEIKVSVGKLVTNMEGQTDSLATLKKTVYGDTGTQGLKGECRANTEFIKGQKSIGMVLFKMAVPVVLCVLMFAAGMWVRQQATQAQGHRAAPAAASGQE